MACSGPPRNWADSDRAMPCDKSYTRSFTSEAAIFSIQVDLKGAMEEGRAVEMRWKIMEMRRRVKRACESCGFDSSS